MNDTSNLLATARCRLVLIVPEALVLSGDVTPLEAACSGGDVASVIVPAYSLGEAAYQGYLTKCVSVGQGAGAAVLGVDHSQAIGRSRADGIHVTGPIADLRDAVEKADGRWIVGCGHADTRDEALRAGEVQPDYVFFGRIGKDVRPEPHKRNVEMGAWWAEMVEIPCIVMGGSDLDHLHAAAATGAEFVALSSAIFDDGADPAERVARANAILEGFPLAEPV